MKIIWTISPHTMSSSDYIDPDNCALDAQGNLKNAEDIVFYESATEEIPIQPSRKGKDRAGGPSPSSALLSYVNSYFGKADPTFWIAVQALKKSAAVLATVVAGRRHVKISNKAKRAAGINTDDEDHKSDNENSGVGSKRKLKSSSANVGPQNKKQRSNEVPKKKQHRTKTVVVVSDDDQPDPEETADTDIEHSEDQADAYEKLRLERENERPV
jgi:hypothetical protein